MTDTELDTIVSRAMARLRVPDASALGALTDLLLDAALARPVVEAIDEARVVRLTVAVVEAERVERALATLVRPAYERQRVLVEKRGDRVKDWLPEGGADLLDGVLAEARLPRGAWARSLVDAHDVRELLAPVLQETLLSFARKLPLVGGAAGGAAEDGGASQAAQKLLGLARGLAQNAGERAQKIADLGRGVLGGLGGEMEKRVASAAREYSQGAFEPLRAAFEARLASEEGRAILARMRTRAVREILEAPAADIAADADALPREAVDRLVARAIAFGARRPELEEMLRAEVRAFAEAHAGETVGQVLDAWGLRELVVREGRAELSAIAAAAARGEAAEAWLRALLAP